MRRMRPRNPNAAPISRREAMTVIGATTAAMALGSSASPGAPATARPATSDPPQGEILRHGAYVCLRVPPHARSDAAAAAVPTLAERLGFRNEYGASDGHPSEAIAFLRRVEAAPASIADED